MRVTGMRVTESYLPFVAPSITSSMVSVINFLFFEGEPCSYDSIPLLMMKPLLMSVLITNVHGGVFIDVGSPVAEVVGSTPDATFCNAIATWQQSQKKSLSLQSW